MGRVACHTSQGKKNTKKRCISCCRKSLKKSPFSTQEAEVHIIQRIIECRVEWCSKIFWHHQNACFFLELLPIHHLWMCIPVFAHFTHKMHVPALSIPTHKCICHHIWVNLFSYLGQTPAMPQCRSVHGYFMGIPSGFQLSPFFKLGLQEDKPQLV